MAQTHHYLFDTATNYTDSTGSSNLTNTGSASINSSGKINQCINMFGYNLSGAAYSSTNLLPTSGNFTIAFWFWTDSFDYSNNLIRILPSVFSNGLLIQWFGKSTNLVFSDNSTGSFYVPSFLRSTWQHVIVSWDGLNWQIYRNNSLLTKTGTLFSPNANTYGSITPFTVDYGSLNYNNRIDDLRIYNEAIDSTERAFIYNSGSGTQANSGGGGGGSATQLSVATQPTRSYSTKNIATQPVVNLLTSGGTVDGAATNTVFANVVSGAGTIGGSTSVSATSGVATFSGLSVAGFGAIGLGFTASGLTAAYSTFFNVDPLIPLLPQRTETSGYVPVSGDLRVGELFVNIPDQKGYVKKVNGTIATVWQAGSSLTSGSVTSGFIGNAAVVSGSIASGQIGVNHLISGLITTLTLGSGQVTSGSIASGQISRFHLGNESVFSGNIGSGQIGPVHLNQIIPNNIQPKTNNFRLSVQSGVAITSTDQSAQSTLYLVPYTGNQIALFDGTNWKTSVASGAVVSLSITGLTSGLPYDVFAYDNSGVPALEFGTVWSAVNTRADAIQIIDGVALKSGTTTRRLVGTILPTAPTTTNDTAIQRYVNNYDNQVSRQLFKTDATNHTYASTSPQIWNLSSGNQIQYVASRAGIGANVSAMTASRVSTGASYARTQIAGGAGQMPSTSLGMATLATSGALLQYLSTPSVTATSVLGYNYFYPQESVTAAGATGTFNAMDLFGEIKG